MVRKVVGNCKFKIFNGLRVIIFQVKQDIFLVDEVLPCDFNSINDDKIKAAKEALQKAQFSFHFIDENNYYFKELFTPSTVSKRCDQCKMGFRNYMVKN